MKKNLAKKVTLSILVGAVLMCSSVVWAMEINVAPPGNPGDGWAFFNSDLIYVPSENSKLISSNNTINIQNAGNVEAFAGGLGYRENDGNAKNNTINISGNGSFTEVMGGYAIGNGDAKGNTVNISGGTISTSLSGGYASYGNAEGNTVNISGGTFTPSLVNSVSIYGGQGDAANNNKVYISGDVSTSTSSNYPTLDVYGGYGANANNNKVHISGNISGIAQIYGGKLRDNTTGNVDNNEVILSGNLDLSGVYLYGSGGIGDEGNKLTIDGGKSSVKSVSNFNNINFENVEWEEDNTGALLSITNSLTVLNDTTVTVGDMTNDIGDKPEVGDKMTLISSAGVCLGGTSSIGEIANKGNEQKFKVGNFVRAKGVVEQDNTNNKITLTIQDVSANEEILVLGESRVAASALTNQGSELIETGLDALARDNDKDTKVFAALYGNASEYETGSHVKVNGWNGIVGVGKTNDKGVTMGAFFENGEGNYRTFNEYKGDFMRGDGEATYNGGGFLYRKDTASGVYTEASLRAGNLQNELRNAVIANDELAGYDIDTFYYGAHVGIGKVIPRGNEGDSIDVYGKFIYTHYDDEDFTIDGGKFHLDSIESERLRLGFRINEVQNNKLNMYYGAAWEYEFGGDSNNSVVGYDVDVNAPSLEGSTVIGEIGAHYKASEKWSIDLNGRAYVGQREGFSGSVQANYSF